ncbi:cysteine desulfurase [Paenibacillus swuensis]|uniref:Cysteine desulfurase n=1 Tax=Paenibacillus swuensis TaxID=1178515 RepID=A0A172TKI8_9BACL|nr:cysteine desulfurase family protein [Paenibacillus swuensis]ANE47337.1 cysteine desulfurase [Paenibacillus swuensis]
MLYFDHSATTPPFDEVVDTMAEVMKRHWGNPSSLHRLGHEAEQLLTRAREVTASALRVLPGEIIFTSSGTESNNLALKGIAYQYRNRGRHLITSSIEHASVAETFRQLEDEGFRVTRLPVDSSGAVSAEDLEQALTDETILVSIMHVNNETGRIQPVEALGRVLANHPRVLFHVDAVQSIGKIPVRPRDWHIDLMSVSAHKIRGPKGVGLLFRRAGVQLHPQLAGGGQEFGARSGTPNVPGIVAAAKACRLTMERDHTAHLYKLRRMVTEQVQALPALSLTGSESEADMAPHIIHFCYPGMKAEVVVHMLEKHQVYVSSQSACGSKTEKPSATLLAMGFDEERARSGIRISLSGEHTEKDAAFLCRSLRMTVDKLQPLVRNWT